MLPPSDGPAAFLMVAPDLSHSAVAWPVTGGSAGDSTRRRGRTHRRRGHTGRRQLIEARERARESRDRQRFGPLADGDSAAP
jgi:hypothetical protein